MLEFCGKSKIYGPDNKFEIESKLLGKFNLNVLLKMSDFFFKICGNMLKVLILPCYSRFFYLVQFNWTLQLVIVMVITWYSEQSKVPKFKCKLRHYLLPGFTLWNLDPSTVYWVDPWVYIREVSPRTFSHPGTIGVLLYIFRIVSCYTMAHWDKICWKRIPRLNPV